MNNILTFDIEEWYHANYTGSICTDNHEHSNFIKNMDMLLELCNLKNCKATFFILGCIGEKYKGVVRLIADAGHEVATHGFGHELAYRQTRFEFTQDVARSKAVLEDIIGKAVIGYRAPSWSIIEKNLDYLEILEELGFKYDASIFPTSNYLYGIPGINRNIHKPVVNGKMLEIFEVPASVISFMGRGIGFSGGFYLRAFPLAFIKNRIRSKNNLNKPAVVYLHPREIDPLERRLKLPAKERLIHYFNIEKTLKKFEGILESFKFTSVEDYLEKTYKSGEVK